MAKVKVEDIRNVALCGHGSSGKTTLTDTILVKTGTVNSHPNVDEGSSICDFDPEEKHHKHSIEASLVHFDHGGKRFHLLDTPGYPEFIGQTIGALHGVDLALIAVNAHAGIEVNTRRAFDEAEKAGLGRMIVITKLDDENVDFLALVESIQEMWGSRCVLWNVPVGQGQDLKGVASTLHPPDDVSGAVVDPNEIREPLIESIIEVDEAVMEKYFEGQIPTDDELAELAVKAIVQGTLIPIVCCSAKAGVGVTELLDTIAQFGPHPGSVPRRATKDGEEVHVTPDPAGPLAARIFKTRIDPFVQKLSFIRIYSGTLKRDQALSASTSRRGIKMGPILEVQGAETHPLEEAGPGEIVAVAKMEELHTGTSLGDYEFPPSSSPRRWWAWP
jgi:elongation factor G